MPYIVQEKRDVLDPVIGELVEALNSLENGVAGESDNREGNLNYVFSAVLSELYTRNYADINNAIGVLNCIALEYYVQFAVPYEMQKAFDNGGVYPGQTGE